MMSPKEILNKLGKETRKFTIGEGENAIEIEVFGLTFPELAHVAPHMDRKNTEYVLNYIVKATVRKSFPNWNDKEVEEFVNNVNPKHLIKLVNLVKEISMPEEQGDLVKNDQAPVKEQ